MSSWTERNKPKKRNYVLFNGIAYPKVLQGKNPTTEVQASENDREAFYNDPAVMLCDDDLAAFNGTEGAPICVEHDRDAGSVGEVRHSWISSEKGRGLRVWGRVYTEDEQGRPLERGKQIADRLKRGEFRGLSVGYGMDLVNNSRGTSNLTDKTFREISLCEEPFFESCRISVAASKEKVSKTRDYKSRAQNSYLPSSETPQDGDSSTSDSGKFFVPIEIMASNQQQQQQTENSGSADAGTPATQPGSGAGAGDGLGAVPQADARELLKQADSLKEQAAAEQKARVALEEKLKAAEEALKAKDAENSYFKEQEAKRAAAYQAKHEPEYKEYVDAVNEQRKAEGEPLLTEEEKKVYHAQFTNPQFELGRKDMWRMHQRTVGVAASLKAKEEALKAEQERLKVVTEKNKQLNSSIGKATNAMVNAHKRDDIAKSLTPEQQQLARDEDSESRKTAEVNASGGRRVPLEPGQIMHATPHANEKSFLAAYGFVKETGVNASDQYQPGYKPVQSRTPMTLYEPRVPRVLYDEETMSGSVPENSARNWECGSRMFAVMCDPRLGLATSDLSRLVRYTENVEARKDAGDWESKRVLSQASQAGIM